MKYKTVTPFALLFLIIAPAIWASGGGGGGGGVFVPGGHDRFTPNPGVDQPYEYGKAMLAGRLPKFRSTKFCLANMDRTKVTRLSGGTVRVFRGRAANTLYNAITDCNQPQLDIMDIADPQEAQALVHYLNNRYNLNLR